MTTLRLSITLLSLHMQNGLETTTPGLFAENDRYILGAFRNSYRRLSVGLGYKIPVKGFECVAGATTGYSKGITPTLALRKDFGDWQVWVLPPYRKSPLGISIAVKVK